MFGHQSKLNNKGIIFIIDLILATAIIVAIIIFIISIMPKSVAKNQYDLVYAEASAVMNNKSVTLNYDPSKDYYCRDYNRVVLSMSSGYEIFAESICTNIIR